jgi:hypothetical protein
MSLISQEINQITTKNRSTKIVTEKKAAKMEENRHFFSKKSLIGISKMEINKEMKIGKIIF